MIDRLAGQLEESVALIQRCAYHIPHNSTGVECDGCKLERDISEFLKRVYLKGEGDDLRR